MGRPSEGKTPTISNLWPHHRSMARTMVAGGLTPGELAALYGFTKGHITRITHSPMFEAEVAYLEGRADEAAVEVREEIKMLAKRALEVLDDQLQKPGVTDGIKQRAAFDILDRAGYGARDKKPKGGKHLHITQVNVGELTTKELKDDVMDLVASDWVERGDDDETND